MVKFLHTADWQMGMKASHAGEAGERVRRARLEAAERAAALAREEGVDFLLLAGDTFEDNGVEGVLIQRTADILAGAGAPVFLLPGNHDPLEPGSVWEHPAWQSRPELHVLDREEPLDLGEVLLYPCPAWAKYGMKDPTGWIPREEGGGRIRIGLAHGSLETLPMEDPVFPIAAGAARDKGLDYLALGHWHSTYFHADGADPVRTAYSGTHEPTRFGERESGRVLLVEIDRPGEAPRIRPVPTGVLSWVSLEREIRGEEDLKALVEEIQAWEEPDRTLIRLRLAGLLQPGAGAWLERIQELLEARFLSGRLDASGLHPSPADPSWVEELPAGPLREAARELRERAELPGREGETARLALLELFSALREAEG